MKSQQKAPIFDNLLSYAKENIVSFHTPGHKYGRSIDPQLKKFTGKKVYSMDVTVFPRVDSLHDPVKSIRSAQNLMSKAYGVQHSFFLVNGSSIGNIAMFLSACSPGDSVIVSRNAHKSVMSGIILAGVWPIWIQPKVDQKLDIIFDSSPEQIKETLKKFPEAKAVFITSPTYNGITTDLKAISEIVHSQGKLLLVDEAHGPHLYFNRKLPVSASESGADMFVQSTHKILSALSQGSVLHVNSKSININRVRKVVSMLQTTSPNYLILASIDLARKQIYNKGEILFNKIIRIANKARKEINAIRDLYCFTREEIRPLGYDLDPTKLTINVTRTGLSGHTIESILSKEYKIQVDCADIFNIIAILGTGSDSSDTRRLVNALADITKHYHGDEKNDYLQLPSLTTEMVMVPRDVFLKYRSKRVSISKATGHISAQTLTPYPPGIPILIPGERITQEMCDYIIDLSKKDIRISGQETDTIKTIKVVSAI
ncbi:MAG: aminotransferase class I/II-fold pyridoxal phosphate-dependent enzyme [bacterium]